MKRTRILFVVLIVLTMLFSSSVAYASPPDQRNFVAHLSGAAERPTPVETDAEGLTVLHVNKEGTELRFKLIVHNIENVTQAHIHCGSAEVAGPVVAFLYPSGPPPVLIPGRFNGVLAEGTITTVIPRPDSPECPGGVANFEELLAKMRSGDAYVNVHTLQFPGGEIRGQIE